MNCSHPPCTLHSLPYLRCICRQARLPSGLTRDLSSHVWDTSHLPGRQVICPSWPQRRLSQNEAVRLPLPKATLRPRPITTPARATATDVPAGRKAGPQPTCWRQDTQFAVRRPLHPRAAVQAPRGPHDSFACAPTPPPLHPNELRAASCERTRWVRGDYCFPCVRG